MLGLGLGLSAVTAQPVKQIQGQTYTPVNLLQGQWPPEGDGYSVIDGQQWQGATDGRDL